MGTTYGAMAQLVAHHTGSVGVRGSSPLSSTSTNGTSTQLSKHHPASSHFRAVSSPNGRIIAQARPTPTNASGHASWRSGDNFHHWYQANNGDRERLILSELLGSLV